MCDDCLNFILKLSIATQIDLIAYADWIRANRIELSVGYVKSGEDDAAVYARMQYVRTMRGVGV